MKKLIAMVLAVAMLAGLGVVAFADGDAAAPDASLSRLEGTYIELFPVFAREDYYEYWMECIGAYVPDEELAGMYYDMLTRNYMGTLMGQEAVEAYGEEPEAMLFDCFFENGLQKITVSGDRISGEDAEGDTVFSHVYSYAGEAPVSFFGEDMGLSLQVYKTDDEDAGIFTYFAFTDDNMADTQHIEFRYGGALDDLGNYSDGEYDR